MFTNFGHPPVQLNNAQADEGCSSHDWQSNISPSSARSICPRPVLGEILRLLKPLFVNVMANSL